MGFEGSSTEAVKSHRYPKFNNKLFVEVGHIVNSVDLYHDMRIASIEQQKRRA